MNRRERMEAAGWVFDDAMSYELPSALGEVVAQEHADAALESFVLVSEGWSYTVGIVDPGGRPSRSPAVWARSYRFLRAGGCSRRQAWQRKRMLTFPEKPDA